MVLWGLSAFFRETDLRNMSYIKKEINTGKVREGVV